MSGIIVKKLHGYDDFRIDLSKPVNIIIGENGTGKSTLINIFFAFMTKQWAKLSKYDFQSIVIEETGAELMKSDIIDIFRIPKRSRSYGMEDEYLQELRARREFFLRRNAILDERSMRELEILEMQLDRHYYDINGTVDMRRSRQQPKSERIRQEKVKKAVNDFLKYTDDVQFVLLPTYRRIEREIEKFLPKDKDGELNEDRITGHNSRVRHIEIYGSGMSDVDSKINDYIGKLREKFHYELSILTQTYIRDVINENYKNSSTSLGEIIGDIPAHELSGYLKDSFSEEEIEKILDFMSNYSEKSKDKENAQFSYFIAKLVKLYTDQLERETPIVEYFNMCNSYFRESERVELRFHRDKFSYSVVKIRPSGELDLKLADLSSGQKQIASLFSHIYLGGESRYFLVIDEPELSISVAWQKRILRDIFQHSKCEGILAVTHSPFIFDNNLIPSVSSINDLRLES